MTHSEYMHFFDKWLNYQYPRQEDEFNNLALLMTVAQIVDDEAELAHWQNRDCWSMFYHAKELTPCTN